MHDIQKKILQLWETNVPSSEIAKHLGITRNAVMGHLYRMRHAGVPMRQKHPDTKKAAPRPIGLKKLVRKAPAPVKPTIEEIQKQSDQKPTGKPVPLMQLKSASCRFVVSGVMAKDFLFCNEQQKPGSPYCAHHHAICYVPKSSIRDLRSKKDDASA
jgi:hypothetical protein